MPPTSTTTDRPASTPTHSPDIRDDLNNLAVRFLGAVLASASPASIGREHWWPRASAALEAAVSGAAGFGHAVTIASRKLQIQVLTAASAEQLAALEPQIAPVFAEWRENTANSLHYIVALTKIARREQAAPTTSEEA